MTIDDASRPGHEEQPSVVVAYVGSAQSGAALRWAAAEAAATRSPLEVLVAWHGADLAWGSEANLDEERAHRLADQAIEGALFVGGRGLVVRSRVEHGQPPSVILGAAHGARALAMGTAGHIGRLGALLGSVSRYVVRHADVPVILLGPQAVGYVESRVVVVSRFGVADPNAVAWAVDRARSRPRCALHLLDTWGAPGQTAGAVEESTRRLARRQAAAAHEHALAQLRRTAGTVPVTGSLFEGPAADIEYVHGVPGDMLVVGAADVDQRPSLTYLRCPVAIVPPGRRVSGERGRARSALDEEGGGDEQGVPAGRPRDRAARPA